MMQLSVRLDMDERALADRWRARAETAEAALSEMVRADADAYVPMDTGELAGSAQSSPGEVTYTAPHARIVYYGGGMRFRTDRHPQATAGWFEIAKAAHGADWIEKTKARMR